MTDNDTIVAVSTPTGYALRAVVRLSGPEAVEIVGRRFRPGAGGGEAACSAEAASAAKAGCLAPTDWRRAFRASRGVLALSADGLEVPVTVYVMRAPRSYTREDVAEIHLPGSPPLLDMVLDDLLGGGDGKIRLARPGEFTERAFLNGRIDLAQAEAVLAVIRARSDSELLAASARLDGRVSAECAAIQDELAGLRALVEAALDFAEHDIQLISEQEVLERMRCVGHRLRLEAEKGRGELASDGRLHVVICGPPNAGKSSLLNRLVGQEVALVHHRPGTTRDPVGSEIELGGVYFAITDTAGLRAGASGIEAAASEKARRLARTAQLLIVVLDGSRLLDADMLELASGAPPNRVLCAVNKCDLPQVLNEPLLKVSGVAGEIVHTSALTGEGMEELREALGHVVFEGRLDASAADCLYNARQRDAVRRAIRRLEEGEGAVREALGYEFVALHLREATDELGEITGTVTSDDILGRIFSRFCIGK